METLQTIDTDRRAELAGHAAVLLRLNGRPIRANNHNEVITQAVHSRFLTIDAALGAAIGLPQLVRGDQVNA